MQCPNKVHLYLWIHTVDLLEHSKSISHSDLEFCADLHDETNIRAVPVADSRHRCLAQDLLFAFMSESFWSSHADVLLNVLC